MARLVPVRSVPVVAHQIPEVVMAEDVVVQVAEVVQDVVVEDAVVEDVEAVAEVEETDVDSIQNVKSKKADTSWSNLPKLGVGLGYRDPYRSSVITNRDGIDFLEIIADHFFQPTTENSTLLRLLANHFTLIPHGLALSIGSAEGVDAGYLQAFAKLIEIVQPPWWSEHIAFTHAGGVDIGHLTPIPKSRVALDCLRENLSKIRNTISVPLILENITETITYPHETYQAAEFLAELLLENDCGMLLGCHKPLHQFHQSSILPD